MIKRLLIAAPIIGMLLGCEAVKADTYPSISFEMGDGSRVLIPSDALTMHFENGKLIASSNGENHELNFADLSKFYFTREVSSVENIISDTSDTSVKAYTPEGILAGSFESEASARAALPAGVYLLQKSNQTTTKIAIR